MLTTLCAHRMYRIVAFAAIMLFSASTFAAGKVNLVYFGANDDAALLGVGQGLEDGSSRAGQEYGLRIVAPESIRSINDPKPAAIFVAADAETLRVLSELNPDVPVFNLVEEHDDLRALCVPNLLHTLPSASMRKDAVAQWREEHPASTAQAIGWHDDFAPYGSDDLNARFEEKREQFMTEQGWAGWAAARIVAEGTARTGGEDTAKLLAYLKRDLRFDGHKEVDLSFRPNGQLRQPLLLVDGDEIVGLAPVPGVADPADLDSLGFGHCPR